MGRDRPTPGNSASEQVGLPETGRGPGLEMGPLRLGKDLDGASDRAQPKTELDVLDRRTPERGIEAADRLERVTPNRTEPRPESGNGVPSLVMNQMMSMKGTRLHLKRT